MRKLSTLFVACGILTAIMLTAVVAAEETVTGVLVEVGCANEPASDAHTACMLRCAQRGEPIGIRTSDGIYTILGDWTANNGDALASLMAKEVEATGDVSGQTITVSDLKLAQ